MRKEPNSYRIEGDVAWIALTKGQETCIDRKNLEKVLKFRWRATWCDAYYAVASVWENGKGKNLYLHKLLLDAPLIDHRDRNSLNNLESNLRPSTPTQSMQNRSVHRNNSCGIKGVSRRGAKFTAKISVARKSQWLGTFDSAPQAAVAYREAALKLFGEFAPAI